MKPKSFKFAGMTIHEANTRLLFQLYHVYDNSEAANIADMVLENLTGWKRIDRVLNKNVKMSPANSLLLEKYGDELSRSKPVQYVLNEAWFYNLKFYVDERVLIPRPETEELVEWTLYYSEKKNGPLTILDIGTGSGCIAIGLKKNNPGAEIFALDISDAALEVAKINADTLQVEITFFQYDILLNYSLDTLQDLDIIISNPPYVPAAQKLSMHENVVQYEPAAALFVSDDDPLEFYKAIALAGKSKLKKDGVIFVEIYEELAEQTAAMFTKEGYSNVETRKDMQGKERMMKISF